MRRRRRAWDIKRCRQFVEDKLVDRLRLKRVMVRAVFVAIADHQRTVGPPSRKSDARHASDAPANPARALP